MFKPQSSFSHSTNRTPCDHSLVEFGQITLSGEWLHAFNKIDDAFAAFAMRCHAVENRFPSFIGAAHLKKMDYLHSFPQHATFPQVLDQSPENIRQFRSATMIDEQNEIQVTRMAPPKAILTPAACYHFYIDLQRRDLPFTRYLTTRNTCYRNESHYVPLERQWSFTMREIVCIGKENEVQSFLEQGKLSLSNLFSKLDLDLHWQVAQDPFFDPSNSPKHLLQTLHPNKHEMVFDNRLAVGSANYHRNYFGESFDITVEGQRAHSACIAFGIERWLAAFSSGFGPDPSQWPLSLLEDF